MSRPDGSRTDANGPEAESLRGKVVLVTGSGHGLGAALARAVAASRARVVINCRADRRRAEALGEEIQRGGGEALACRADVSVYEEAEELVEETIKAFGRLDVLVNVVGAFSWKPVAEVGPADWRDLMASNLDSVYNMSRLALPHMRRGHWGRIINLGAVGAERTEGPPNLAAFSAAKAAVIAFSKALALEEARCGVTVNVVCPGVLTDGDDGSTEDDLAAAARLGERAPIGRPGSLDDVVRAILFFASPAADYLTGQVLAVAGGWRL
ncbi:MAG TPA: SDR family NAD(P)-dependent oxidoreductase [Vicinamibacteria bacterium]|nr:SDR family NAD(P)-dependent oxidoreductase [Vicinamibacteria bacterium]